MATETEQNSSSELEALRKECEQLRQKEFAAAQEYAALEEECTSLRAHLAEVSDEVVGAHEELEKLRRRDDDVAKPTPETNCRAHSAASPARIADLETDIGQLEQKIAMIAEADQNYLPGFEDLKLEFQQSLQKQLESARESVTLQQECLRLQEQLAEESNECHVAQEQLATLRQRSVARCISVKSKALRENVIHFKERKCDRCERVLDRFRVMAEEFASSDRAWAKLVDDIQHSGKMHIERLATLTLEPEASNSEGLRRACDEIRDSLDASGKDHVDGVVELQQTYSSLLKELQDTVASNIGASNNMAATASEPGSENPRLREELASVKKALVEAEEEMHNLQKQLDSMSLELKARKESSSAPWFLCG
eukprot:TRINITY_DN59274_c0_g1_i1.p1 TRINITY_DN59274_c0_g1~~TRINITY_DN59274_c0_g1_i1.p1  ORF type:complete len:369 (-),score=82.38 TRINITY_DN59274_c0_g1_i1:207-1313(-)